jgi:hypothetical protein
MGCFISQVLKCVFTCTNVRKGHSTIRPHGFYLVTERHSPNHSEGRWKEHGLLHHHGRRGGGRQPVVVLLLHSWGRGCWRRWRCDQGADEARGLLFRGWGRWRCDNQGGQAGDDGFDEPDVSHHPTALAELAAEAVREKLRHTFSRAPNAQGLLRYVSVCRPRGVGCQGWRRGAKKNMLTTDFIMI